MNALARELRFFASIVGPLVTGQMFRHGRWRRCVDELYAVAVGTVPVLLAACAFLSVMLVSEFSFHMRLVLQQDSLVPGFSTAILLRELGPVVCAFLLAARVGAGYAAELATRKATEQLEALEAMGVDVGAFFLAPRLLAGAIGGCLLTIVGVFSSSAAAALFASTIIRRNPEDYFRFMWWMTHPRDLGIAAAKGAVFGALVVYLSLRAGMRAKPGSSGSGEAATQAVVGSSVAIFVADFLVTALAW